MLFIDLAPPSSEAVLDDVSITLYIDVCGTSGVVVTPVDAELPIVSIVSYALGIEVRVGTVGTVSMVLYAFEVGPL